MMYRADCGRGCRDSRRLLVVRLVLGMFLLLLLLFLSSRSRRWRVLRESLRFFFARLAALAATAAEGFAFGMLVEERV